MKASYIFTVAAFFKKDIKFDKMYKNKLNNVRNVIAIAICLIGITLFSGCERSPKAQATEKMKGNPKSNEMALRPAPHVIVSVRDKEGRNNAMVVGFAANVSMNPAMIMVGIDPRRFSHHIIKENGCFVINLPLESFRKEFNYLGTKSGRDGDKFAALDLKWKDSKYVNAPILTDCPVNIECSVVESTMPGSNELFIGKVEAVHVDEEYLDENGNILWSKMDLIYLKN